MDKLFPGLWGMPNIHPMLVHFPVVLFPMALLFWTIGVCFRRDDLFRVGTWLLYLGVLAAAAAVSTGLWAMEKMGHHVPGHDKVHVHRDFMFVASGLGIAVATAAFLSRKRSGRRLRVLLGFGLLATVSVLALGADRGAELVFVLGLGTRTAEHRPKEEHKEHEIDHGQPHEKHDGHENGHEEEKPPPELSLERWERSLAEARSFSMKVETEIVSGGKTTTSSGTIRFKPGDRFQVDLGPRLLMRSDGNVLMVQKGDDPPALQPFLKEMSRFLIGATARSGIWILHDLPEVVPDLEQALQVSDFTIGQGERIETKVFLFTLTVRGKKASVSLWIDAERMIPVLRTVRMDGLTIVEKYTEVSTEEIPDDAFRHAAGGD